MNSINLQKKIIFLLMIIFSSLLTGCQNPYANKNITVYVVQSTPFDHGRYYNIASANTCRITCFSHDVQHGRSIGNGIYAMGSVNVPGKYDHRGVCRPTGYGTADISKSPDLKTVCKVFIKHCKNQCWAGGNA